jgi:hypothetical protein
VKSRLGLNISPLADLGFLLYSRRSFPLLISIDVGKPWIAFLGIRVADTSIDLFGHDHLHVGFIVIAAVGCHFDPIQDPLFSPLFVEEDENELALGIAILFVSRHPLLSAHR